MHKECRSMAVKLHLITVYWTVVWECAVALSNATFGFFGLPIVSCSMINSLILGCLWPLVVVLNTVLTLGFWRSAISHLSDSTWCHRTPLCHIQLLNLDILQGSFRLCNWLSLRRLASWINHLRPLCWSTFWKLAFNLQLGSRFDIMDFKYSSFVFWHMPLYMS